jgi:hypothetical protein
MEKLKSDDLKSQLWQSVRAQGEVCEMYQRDEEEIKLESTLHKLSRAYIEGLIKMFELRESIVNLMTNNCYEKASDLIDDIWNELEKFDY